MPMAFFILGIASLMRFAKFARPQWLAVVFVFLSVVRVGEASHPGPSDAHFILGVANPTGLRCKSMYVTEHMAHGDLWAFSETHLSSRELHTFNAGLKFAHSPFAPLLGGFPVPPSRDNAGSWKGVGVLSKTPVRHIPKNWPDAIQCSSRAMAYTTLIDDVWLTGAVVYGEPDSQHYPFRLQHNESLLQSAIESVGFLSSGPRVIAGDWNVSMGEIPAFDTLSQLGFKDLQELAAERWGIPPRPTCKSKTRKDFCFISPELQEVLVDVSVLDDVWPDHSILQGKFQRFRACIPRQIWKNPCEFPWPAQWYVDPNLWTQMDAHPDEKYRVFWKAVEDAAQRELPFPVPKRSCGRANTVSTSPAKVGAHPHVRVGRKGDFQPQFHGSSLRHAHWVRQVRRLQAFVRSCSADGSHSHYAVSVWAAIVRAKGFTGGFVQWWSRCPHRVHGAPLQIPWVPPSGVIATRIFETLALQVRSLESQLISTSRQYARLRRARNPRLIFQDLRPMQSSGVDYLIRPIQSSIVSVDESDHSIVVEPPHGWSHDRPIVCQGLPLSLIHVEPDCIWLEDSSALKPGDVISQVQCSGTQTDLEKMFVDEWKARWERHKDVPDSRWATILDFARQALPRLQFSWPAISPDVLSQLIAAKKSSSACGLDGVSIADLKSLPRSAIENVCSMYREAEDTGVWPSQLLMGRVACLAKTDEPRTVLDYRPITVLGMLYRVWGSYHARRAIRALDAHLPDSLYGSRPARFAGQVWSQLLWAVEDATIHGIALSGLMADLQKAFNHLPRLVVFEAAALLGIPMSLLTAWAGALTLISRRFQLGQGLTKPVFSTTGLPEGDGLSCLGMVIIDVLFHLWHQHFFPLCQPVSYVDDWTILITDPSLMTGVFACLSRFTDALDLMLDSKKTFAWSTSGKGRKSLVEQGFRVATNCKLLGAHVQVSRKHTNATQTARVSTLQPLWPKLKLSAAAYEVKVQAIRAAAWPKGLHAIAATTVSLQTFASLRAGAMKGLNADGAGCNAMVHLGLLESPLTDPHFWSIYQTFKMVRECGIEDVVHPALFALATGDEAYANNGITATVLTRIQTFGWHVSSPHCLLDDFGPFNLFSICIAELRWRMEWAWLKVVAACVAHRPGFSGLWQIDPARTRAWLSKLNCSDRAAYRKILNGAHVTQDGKHYCQEADSDVCQFCDCSDSRFHRFWGCGVFEECRQGIDSDLMAAIPDLPESVTCYGWALRPSTFHSWFSYFLQLVPPVIPAIPWPFQSQFHIFTDGSCCHPQYPDLRFASYALILVDSSATEHACILESGPLPGLRQTSLRAGLFAVHRAIKFAAYHGVSLMVWSDCLNVVRRLRRICLGAPVKINSSNADLWSLIAEDIHGGGVSCAGHESCCPSVSCCCCITFGRMVL